MMEPFGWSNVAGIAGVSLTILLAVIGWLLGTLLKRQSNSNGVVIKEVTILNKSLEEKVTTEIDDRRKSTSQFYRTMEIHREQTREDIKELSDKLSKQSGEIVASFKEVCIVRQEACSSVIHTEITHQKEQLRMACNKINRVEEDRNDKWTEQRELNMKLLSKVDINV